MEPGVVYTARTLAKDRVTRRGDATCYELVKSDFFVESMSALDIHLTGSTPNKKVNKFDLLLFVKTGNGSLLVSGENIELKKGTAVQIRSGEDFKYENAKDLEVIEVYVPDASGPFGRRLTSKVSGFVRSVQQGISSKGLATENREFEVLFDAQRGCANATMFIGFIPTSGAPAHFHLYDEICQIISGSGSLEAFGKVQELAPGSTFPVVPRMLHSIINKRDEDLWILGVFRPQGSPAAAYYPDGTPAPGYTEV
jgi:mannose-6-phosphate isomerase-like protein (cupin superfamily)